MTAWLQYLINMVLPPRCIRCGKVLGGRNGLCAECFKKISFVAEPYCARCGHPFISQSEQYNSVGLLCGACLAEKRPLFKLRRFAFVYNDESKNLILGFKFLDKTIYAETLAGMLLRAGTDIWKEKPDLLLAVPIHPRRLLQRRYNQSALLVQKLSEMSGIKAEYAALQRVRNTVPQVELSGRARRNNLRHAFAVKEPEKIAGKKVVLIDDVETTGSTLKECAKVLKKAGAKQIYALTLARPTR